MLYFIILPLYVLFLIVLAAGCIAARYSARLRPAYPYLLGGSIGQFVGFILANILITALGLLPILILKDSESPTWLQNAGQLVGGVTLILGPLVASIGGVLVGAVAGLSIVFIRSKRRANAT